MGGVPLVWAHIVGNIAFFVSYAQIQLMTERSDGDLVLEANVVPGTRDAVGADVLSTTLAGGTHSVQIDRILCGSQSGCKLSQSTSSSVNPSLFLSR